MKDKTDFPTYAESCIVRGVLTEAYERWMKIQQIELASAEEVLANASLKLNDYQVAWLNDFISLWDKSSEFRSE